MIDQQGYMELIEEIGVPELRKRMGNRAWGEGLISSRFQLKDAVSQVAQMLTAIIWEIPYEPVWELRNEE